MPCLLLITTLLFIRGEMKIWKNIKKSLKIFLKWLWLCDQSVFHIYFCFESLAVLFRVMNSEILTIFKMLLINENYRLTYTWFKNFPTKKSANLIKKKTRLNRYWDYRADGSQAKAKLYNFKTLRLDISFANNIEICHLFCELQKTEWILEYFQLYSL